MLNLIREKRRTISIKIDQKGELIVKAPKTMPLNEILNFTQKHSAWIKSKQESVQKTIEVNRPLLEYEKVLFLGDCYEVIFSENTKKITIDGSYLILPQKYLNSKAKYIEKWLKQRALEVFESRVLYLSNTFNLPFLSLNFTNSKTKWGSCSMEKEISLNWRLVMLTPKLIDYVIIHELGHTIEFNHSKKFWQMIETMLPDYKSQRDLLKQCGYILTMFR